jgi:hypothetical protein
MFSTAIDPQAQRRQALGKVYALLISLADQQNETARLENFAEDTRQAAEKLDPKPSKESNYEKL